MTGDENLEKSRNVTRWQINKKNSIQVCKKVKHAYFLGRDRNLLNKAKSY